MSNVKKGDLALIIATQHAANRHLIGKCVKVLREAPIGEYDMPCGRRTYRPARAQPAWIVADDEATWVIAKYRGEMHRYCSLYHNIRDIHLLPLRDPDADVAETQDRTVTA